MSPALLFLKPIPEMRRLLSATRSWLDHTAETLAVANVGPEGNRFPGTRAGHR